MQRPELEEWAAEQARTLRRVGEVVDELRRVARNEHSGFQAGVEFAVERIDAELRR